jgi:serine/threonine protein kinase
MIGETVGQYRIVERLGEGGMGDVYLAEDLKLRRKAAVKIIAPHLTRDAARRQRFVKEALLAASIDHPHIAAIYDVDQVGDRTYIAVGAGRAAAEGRFDESIRLYETVVGRYPDTERAYTSLSFIYNPVFGAVPDANKELSISHAAFREFPRLRECRIFTGMRSSRTRTRSSRRCAHALTAIAAPRLPRRRCSSRRTSRSIAGIVVRQRDKATPHAR